jgi:predicted dehydrogenase
MRTGAAAGAGVLLSQAAFGTEAPAKNRDAIHLGLIGAGAQGQVLMDAVIKISKDSPVQFRAVCDIWEPNRTRVARTIDAYKAYGHAGKAYVDYREMLDTEKDLDAVLVATPDFWHAEHAVACLKKGLHVYCEKEMSNTLEGARRMVETARATGKLLQIGHQRRSNPRYRFCYDKIIQQAKLLGRITTINGQWNRARSACEDLGWTEGAQIPEATLNQYGFASMQQFRNWRWYKGLGGGPVVDLGSHQIDIYNWFLQGRPSSVVASGGIDYWTEHQWYDNAIAIYEYHTPKGAIRATYQTLTTNSNGGYFEQFMGDEGTLDVSESGRGAVYRESWVEEKKWYPWEDQRLVKREAGLDQRPDIKSVLDVRSSPKPPKYNLLVEMNKPFHQPHMENFFEAIRGNETLNCPAEIGYETAVTVLKVNEAIEAGRKLEFKSEDFVV